MSTHERAPRGRGGSRSRRVALVALLAIAPGAVTACGFGGTGQPDGLREVRDGHNPGAVPTLPGGIDLGSLAPTSVLVGAGLSFGTPLPSEQAAAEAFTAEPEISAVLARRVYLAADGRHLADVVVLVLDGSELFDAGVLAAFLNAAVSGVADAPATRVPLAGREVLRAAAPDGSLVAVAFREANLLSVVAGPAEADVRLIVTRQVEARGRGEIGAPAAATPLIALPVDAAFVAVPSVSFAVIPPPEEQEGPVPPAMAGAMSVQGRYGVVAGERRTVVWAIAADPGTYLSAEALDPVMRGLVADRSGGTAPTVAEVGGRVVYSSTNSAGTPSAQVFRHQGLVLLVEGDRPDQLDAVTTAWIAALGPINQGL